MRRFSFLLLSVTSVIVIAAALPTVAAASTNSTATVATTSSAGEKFLAAGIAFGLAALGAGIGIGTSGSAAIAAVTEKAEVRTTALIFVVLAEAIAIYGFAIAFIILGQTG